jgi:hypothetical protein
MLKPEPYTSRAHEDLSMFSFTLYQLLGGDLDRLSPCGCRLYQCLLSCVRFGLCVAQVELAVLCIYLHMEPIRLVPDVDSTT